MIVILFNIGFISKLKLMISDNIHSYSVKWSWRLQTIQRVTSSGSQINEQKTKCMYIHFGDSGRFLDHVIF